MNNNVITCVKCGNKVDLQKYDDPLYCNKCGMVLYNYCPNCCPEGLESDFFDYMPITNEDAFCTSCGSKTIFHDFLIDKEN